MTSTPTVALALGAGLLTALTPCVLPFRQVEVEELTGPGTVHGRDKVRQQMMQCLGASDKLGLVLDYAKRVDEQPQPAWKALVAPRRLATTVRLEDYYRGLES